MLKLNSMALKLGVSLVMLLVSIILIANTHVYAASNLVQVTASEGGNMFTPREAGNPYFYGPSIIINEDNTIDSWACGNSLESDPWDKIWYKRSTDGGNTWTTNQVVLTPTPGSADTHSACDPGVIKYNDYYYMGYTSTAAPAGFNNVFLARSTSPTGPFDKWNGTGWGGNPAPIITWGGTNPNDYGYGEPSLVVKDGVLYMYVSDVPQTSEDAVQHTSLFTVSNLMASNWPATIEYQGRVLRHDYIGQDSLDFKYVPSLNRFIAVGTNTRFTPNAKIDVWQSDDGYKWERASYSGIPVKDGAHNAGISGDASGHLITSMNNFIAYAQWPTGVAGPDWPTYRSPITLSTIAYGTKPLLGNTSSSINWSFTSQFLWDGDHATAWSSKNHTTQDAIEWAYIDLGKAYNLDGLQLMPRTDGQGYPINFELQASNDKNNDQVDWKPISGQQYTNVSNPGSVLQTYTFSSPVNARFIRVKATKLGADSFGTPFMQLAEMIPVYSSNQSYTPPSLSINEPKNVYNNLSKGYITDKISTTSDKIAQKFTAGSAFNAVDASVGYVEMKLYLWNTDYSTTLAGTPIAGDLLVQDGQFRTLKKLTFPTQAAGTYLVVLSLPDNKDVTMPSTTVKRYVTSTNPSTAFKNGEAVAGDYAVRYFGTDLGTVTFSDDFSGTLNNWSNLNSKTSIIGGGEFRVETKKSVESAEGSTWTDYTLKVDARIQAGAAGIVFRKQDDHNLYMWQLNTDGKLRLHKKVDGIYTVLREVDCGFTPYINYNIKITAVGSTIYTYVNSLLVDIITDSTFISGKIGFSQAAGESAVFNNVTVQVAPFVLEETTPLPLISDDFSNDLIKWKNTSNASIVSGQLSITNNESMQSLDGGLLWSDYTIDLDVNITNSAAGIVFRKVNDNNYYMWQLNENGKLRIHKKVNGVFTLIKEVPCGLVINTFYHVTIVATGSTIETYINSVLIDTTIDSTFSLGHIGFRESGSESAVFDNVVINGTVLPIVNIALNQSATASSTDFEPKYSPSFLVDGVKDTNSLKGWSNVPGALPAWVEISWGTQKTFSTIDLYTPKGYETKDYRIQWWDGTNWQDCFAQVTNNTLTYQTYTFTPVTSDRIKISLSDGTAEQPSIARLTEIEVYNY